MSRSVELYLGPPGTGKTTTLLKIVQDSGLDPEDIAYVGFTRKAAYEAQGRAIEAGIADNPDELPFFRTLHSTAFRQLRLTRQQLMLTKNFTELGHFLGLDFKFDYDEGMERAPIGGGLGDRALRIYSIARSRMCSLEEAYRYVGDEDVDFGLVTDFCHKLETYKRRNKLYDFTDILDAAQKPLPVGLFILDEAQDLTRQQWALARRLARSARRVVFAGDDDQAIFQWAGADVDYFLRLEAARTVLPKSYRLPKSVWQFANRIVTRISARYAKQWEPRDEEGEVRHIQSLEEVDMRKDTWLLLTRHQSHVRTLERLCREQGVVYQVGGKWSNMAPSVRAAVSYEQLRRGEVLRKEEVANILAYVVGEHRLFQREYRFNDLFHRDVSWMEALTKLSDEDREYLRALRANGESLRAPGRVVISTIHGSKGGEADHVLLLSDCHRKVMEGFDLDPDPELRVWYVAATRARKTLLIHTNKEMNNLLYFFTN